ncbi:MAG: phospholipase [Azospirillum brasilense]|nr:MAG: phospholipase [Azospirillum brasilense]
MTKSVLTGPELAPQSGTVKHVVILLHGVGSNGDDLIGLAPMLAPALPDTQFLSPNGAQPFDQAPFGYQWFSLRDRSHSAMLAGVQAVAPTVDAYIDEVKARFGVDDANIALVGFSQGTMTSLYVGLRRAQPLAGIVGFSGALIDAANTPASVTPVCLIHGEWDEVVPYAAMVQAREALSQKGIRVEAHARPNLGHSIDGEGLEAAVDFLRARFGMAT